MRMAWDEDFDRWFRRWRMWPGFNFKDIDRMFDDMFHEAFKMMPKDFYREARCPDGGFIKYMTPFVYGYSMTLSPDGRPIIREFGNKKPSSKQTPFGISKPSLDIREEREPLIDIVNDNGAIHVIAEVPGVEKNDIELNCSERSLTISVNSKRKYYKDIDLPTEVDPKSAKAKYTNGVLEVALTKVRMQTSEQIKIE